MGGESSHWGGWVGDGKREGINVRRSSTQTAK